MLKMISPDEALKIVMEHAVPLATEPKAPSQALGCVLAEDIHADRDYPPFHRAMMDGFAVALSDAGRNVPVSGEVAAGQAPDREVAPGHCVRIMTGAPCPQGTEAVVQKECVQEDETCVTLPPDIEPGLNIAERGCEARQGAVLLEKGALVTPLAVAVAAAVGTYGAVQVTRPPRVAVLITGNELCRAGQTPEPWQIRDSNGPMLQALFSSLGLDLSCELFHVTDTLDALERMLASATALPCDILILTGGVSAGKYDHVPDALKAFGAELIFHKVTQKPGKPLLFARKGRQLIFGLPGNPLAVHLGFHRYIAPAIRKMMGRKWEGPWGCGRMSSDLQIKNKRTVFALVKVEWVDQIFKITPLRGQGSADIYAVHEANAMVRIPPEAPALRAGEEIAFEWLGERRWAP